MSEKKEEVKRRRKEREFYDKKFLVLGRTCSGCSVHVFIWVVCASSKSSATLEQ